MAATLFEIDIRVICIMRCSHDTGIFFFAAGCCGFGDCQNCVPVVDTSFVSLKSKCISVLFFRKEENMLIGKFHRF